MSLIQTIVNRSEEPQYSAISPLRSFYSREKTFSFDSSRSRTRYLGVLPVEQNEPFFLERDFMLSVFKKCLHEKLFGSSRKPSGEPPQMLPLRLLERLTGTQAAASPSSKQTLLANLETNLKILEAIFLGTQPKEILQIYYSI